MSTTHATTWANGRDPWLGWRSLGTMSRWSCVVTAATKAECRDKLLLYLSYEANAGRCIVLRRGHRPEDAAETLQYAGGRIVDRTWV
jgi:hypothetical protein